jgi:hypothetical protein
MADKMDSPWIRDYKSVTARLVKFGWFVPPFMLGFEFDRIRKVADEIAAAPPLSEDDRRATEQKIYLALCDSVFHPNYRAHHVVLALRLNYLSEYSHIYESAIFAYYKREYMACIVCLLGSLEGILLSFFGCSRNDRSSKKRPNMQQLIERVLGTRLNYPDQDVENGFNLIREMLAEFLRTWIYRSTWDSGADLSLSLLNRHYILHGVDSGNFYRPEDAHRMILSFDLLIDFLGQLQHVFEIFLPEIGKNPLFDRRRMYYAALSNGSPTIEQSWVIERNLLKDHRNYHAPSNDPSVLEGLGFPDVVSLQKIVENIKKKISGDSVPFK